MSISTDNAAANFNDIKNKVLSYVDEMTKKNKNEGSSTTTDTEQSTTTDEKSSTGNDDSTDKMKLQFTTLLEKVTSFVNKQQDKSENEPETSSASTSTIQGEGEKSSDKFSAEDLQVKLTSFVRSLSLANKTTSTETTTDTSTTTTEPSIESEGDKKDQVKDIMNQLKSAFAQFTAPKTEESKERSLGTIDESDEKSKPNPVEEFFSFVQGMLQKDNIEKNAGKAKEVVENSASNAKKSVDEGPEKNPILCGAF